MSKVTVEYHTCDRCGIRNNVEGPFYIHPDSDRVLEFCFRIDEYQVGKKTVFWKDLCGACNEQVFQALKGLRIGKTK